VPDLAPVPIVATASTSGSPGKKSRRNVPNMIEVPLQDQSAFPVPFPHSPSNSSLTNLPPLPRSVASDSIPVPSHPLYSNNFTDAPPSISEASANDGHDNTGGGGLFSRLARPFLSSQSSSKRSIKTSKATPPVQAIATTMEANGAAAATPSAPSTPRSNNGAGSGPRTPQSPLSKPGSSHGQGSDRVSEDSSLLTVGHSSRPGTPLSPLSKALERGSLDETKRRVPKVPATPTEPVAFPRVSSGSDTEVGGWRGGMESGWVDEID